MESNNVAAIRPDRMSRPALPLAEGGMHPNTAAALEAALQDPGATAAAAQTPLMRLYEIVAGPMPVPEIGARASEAVGQAIERAAQEMENAVKDAEDRLEALKQEAQSFLTTLRESGAIVRFRIEDEVARAAKLTALMKQARSSIAETAGDRTAVPSTPRKRGQKIEIKESSPQPG